MAGASRETVEKIMACATTDAATDVLKEACLFEETAVHVMEAIDNRLKRKAAGAFQIGAVVFSKVHGLFGITGEAEHFLLAAGFRGDLKG